MTTIPKPADPTVAFAATYDAWNRLVKIAEGQDTVAEYVYDGARRRVVKKTFDDSVLDETRHFYYTEPSRWQVIEERLAGSSDAERQFVWGLRYVDDLVLRDRATESNGVLDERLYGLQDANWNVTALVDAAGVVQERYAHSAYGVTRVMTPAFLFGSSSIFGWETCFAGYRHDVEVDLFHVRTRVLMPSLGWLQRDPLHYSDGTNLYQYAKSNPAAQVDPTGQAAADLALCFLAALEKFIVIPVGMTFCASCLAVFILGLAPPVTLAMLLLAMTICSICFAIASHAFRVGGGDYCLGLDRIAQQILTDC